MSFSVQQRQAEGKTAALARLTLQQDLAPVQVRQLKQLTDAMAEYARTRGGMTAVEFTGKHYDMGNKLKVAEAQVELALQHPEIGEAFRAYLKEFCKTL